MENKEPQKNDDKPLDASQENTDIGEPEAIVNQTAESDTPAPDISVQLEDTQATKPVDQPKIEEKTTVSDLGKPELPGADPAPVKKTSWIRKAVNFLIGAIVFLLAGFLIAYFVYILPVQKNYQIATKDLAKVEGELLNVQANLDQTSSDLEDARNELARLQMENKNIMEAQELSQSNLEFNLALYDLKYEVALARIAILVQDKISARQAVSMAGDHFDSISELLDDEVASGIEERLDLIKENMADDTKQALNDLRSLSENLERIPLK
mgnify:CR=1 FL=1